MKPFTTKKPLLKVAISCLAGICTAVLLLASYLIYDPLVAYRVIPAATWQDWLASAGVNIDLRKVKLSLGQRGFAHKRLRVQSEPQCIQFAMGVTGSGCIEALALSVGIDYGTWPPQITTLGPITVKLKQVALHLPQNQEPDPQPQEPQPTAAERLHSLLPFWQATEFAPISVTLEDGALVVPAASWEAAAGIGATSRLAVRHLSLTATPKDQGLAPNLSVTGLSLTTAAPTGSRATVASASRQTIAIATAQLSSGGIDLAAFARGQSQSCQAKASVAAPLIAWGSVVAQESQLQVRGGFTLAKDGIRAPKLDLLALATAAVILDQAPQATQPTVVPPATTATQAPAANTTQAPAANTTQATAANTTQATAANTTQAPTATTTQAPTATTTQAPAATQPSPHLGQSWPPTLPDLLPAPLAALTVAELRLVSNRLTLADTMTTTGPLTLTGSWGHPGAQVTLALPDITFAAGSLKDSNLTLGFLGQTFAHGLSLTGQTKLHTSDLQAAITLAATIPPDLNLNLELAAKSQLINADGGAQLSIKGTLSQQRDFAGTIALTSQLAAPVPLTVATEDCGFRILDIASYATRLDFDFACRSRQDIALPNGPWSEFPMRNLSLQLTTKAKGSLVADQGLNLEPQISAELAPNPLNLTAMVAATGPLEVTWHQGQLAWGGKPEVKGMVAVANFGKLVAALAATSAAVPAPLNQLQGGINLTFRSDALGANELKVPFNLTTKLGSQDQRLKTQSQGQLQVDLAQAPPIISLDGHSQLTDIATTLFKLTIAPPPQLVPDPRIHLDQADAKPAPPDAHAEAFLIPPHPDQKASKPSAKPRPPLLVSWSWATSDKPLAIATNLSPTPIAFHTQGQFATAAGLTATLATQPFYLTLFRRQALIKYFRVKLLAEDTIGLDGAIEVDYTDAKVQIQILGTAANPIIHLESTPAMSRQRLMVMLLFGKDMEDLDPDHIASVNQAQAAIASGAVSLASLYYLAATPVQSISYDPTTNFVGVKFKVAAGTTINIGRGSEFERLGSKTRLWENWFLNSYLDRRADNNILVTSLVEWFKRFW